MKDSCIQIFHFFHSVSLKKLPPVGGVPCTSLTIISNDTTELLAQNTVAQIYSNLYKLLSKMFERRRDFSSNATSSKIFGTKPTTYLIHLSVAIETKILTGPYFDSTFELVSFEL